ncbi:hypothetical protein POTOM_031923 [Populus tomentosa]|uniref:Uncharacterized protein n=1 Tax=Populus tomentosa TaxID=118781 RepID=A0A8X8CS20_POPTO|nr:hypothetical protein POTOM_031923 [Populus tomentosa]
MASTIEFSRPPTLAFLLLLLMSFLYISLAAHCGSMGGSSGESSPVSSGGGSSFSSGGRGSYSWDYIDSGGSRGQGGGRRGGKVDVIMFVTGVVILVGLMGTAFSLQNELNEISSTANTSTARGWHRILTKKYSTTGVLLTRFKQLSSEENEKFDAGSRVTILVAANAKFCYLDSSLSINYPSSFTEEIKGALRSLDVDAEELELMIMTS